MKFIHISDLHIGKKLHEQDLVDNHIAMFEQLERTMREEHPDALLICGDIFQTSTPTYSARKTYCDGMIKAHKASPETQIIVIAGNHDGPNSLDVYSELWDFVNVKVFNTISQDEDRNAIYENNLVKIENKDGELLGYVAAVPYTFDHAYPHVTEDGKNNTQAYFKAITQKARELAGDKPVVLMAHLAVLGDFDFEGQTSREEVIGNIECLNVSELGDGYDYLALGHIHKRQAIQKNARYSGSPIEVSFDEEYSTDRPHGFNIVTVEGREVNVNFVPVKPVHMLKTLPSKTEFAKFGDVLKLLEEYKSDTYDYIRLNVKQETLTGDYLTRINKVEDGLNLKVLAVNQKSERGNSIQASEIGVTTMAEMRQLTPETVAKNTFKEALTDELMELLKEAISRVEEENANKKK